VTLHISPSAQAMAASAATEAAKRLPVKLPEGGWLLNLQTSVAGLCDTAAYVGAAPSASDGPDRTLDLAKPPAPDMDAYVYLGLMHDDWGNQNGAYAVDVRSSDTRQVWNLRVMTNMVGEPVTLRWPDMSSLPKNVKPVLVDVATGKRVYMRTTAGYSFEAQDQARDLQIVVERGGAAGLTVSGLAAASGAGGTSVSYTLTQAAAVTVEVRNISGVLVRQLASEDSQPAGRNSVLWDERNAKGAVVPAGRYLVRVTARSAEGQQASAMGTVLIQH
jgi:hypothetical protein